MAQKDRIVIKTQGMKEMEMEFDKASLPNVPPKGIIKLDRLFGGAAAAVRAKVHIEYGHLKASGRDDTHYVGDVWVGEIRYAAHPGIFELARGDRPTRFHPEGGHFFFNAIEPFIPHMEEAINSLFDGYFGGVR